MKSLRALLLESGLFKVLISYKKCIRIMLDSGFFHVTVLFETEQTLLEKSKSKSFF